MTRLNYVLLLSIGLTLGALSTSAKTQDPGNSSYASFDVDGWTTPDALFSDNHNEVDELEMQVKEGEVPSFLHGSLYRVGAGMYSLGKRRVNNLMDGLAKISKWTFNKQTNSVKLSSKFLRSDVYNRSMANQELVPMPYFGEVFPPLTKWEEFQILEHYIHLPDNNNIAMWDLGEGAVTATTEMPNYIDVDYTNLDYIKKYNPRSSDKSLFSMEMLSASHFRKHPVTGHSINYKLAISWNTAYHVYEYKTDTNGEMIAELIGSVPVHMNDIRIVHSFGVTENFVVLPRFSLCYSMKNMIHLGADMFWDVTKPSVFDVVSIKHKRHMFSFEFSAYEAQHVINAFERTNSNGELEIVIDYPTRFYPADFKSLYDMLNIDCIKDPNCNTTSFLKGSNHERITRFILNVDTGVGTNYTYPVMWSPTPDAGMTIEFPWINPAYNGKPYCFAWFQAWDYNANSAMGLMKADMCQETSIGWSEKNKFPAEPIFVGRPDATAEDDGVILSPVFDSDKNSTSLYIWNAQNLEVLAVLDSPVIVPFTLHGVWIDNVGF